VRGQPTGRAQTNPIQGVAVTADIKDVFAIDEQVVKGVGGGAVVGAPGQEEDVARHAQRRVHKLGAEAGRIRCVRKQEMEATPDGVDDDDDAPPTGEVRK